MSEKQISKYLFILLFIFLVVNSFAQESNSKNYALIIGTDTYYYTNNKLKTAVDDGLKIASELEKVYGFKVDFGADLRQSHFMSKLRQYQEKEFLPNDKLLIFISHLGHYFEEGEGYIGFADTRNERKKFFLSHSELVEEINKIPCQNILLIMDVDFGFFFKKVMIWAKYKPIAFQDSVPYTRYCIVNGDMSIKRNSKFTNNFIKVLKSYGGNDYILTMNEIISAYENFRPEPVMGYLNSNVYSDSFALNATIPKEKQEVEIIAYDFKSEFGAEPVAGSLSFLNLEIKNTGKITAEDIRIRISPPSHQIKESSDNLLSIKEMQVNEIKRAEFNFRTYDFSSSKNMVFNVRIEDNEGKRLDRGEYTLLLHPIGYYEDLDLNFINELRKRKYYALIICNEDYDDNKIIDLDYPVEDGTNLENILYNNYTFNKENIVFLKNPGRAEILNKLDEFTRLIQSNDNLLIFYAGHGVWDEQLEQGYWLPSDARRDSKSDWISNSEIQNYIGGIKSKHTLLITDACFSGAIFKTRDAFSGNEKVWNALYELPSRKAMTSGALQTVPDKSVFMKYLLKRLSENNSPIINSELLFYNFKNAVINNSPNSQVPQYGLIHQTGDEGGDFLFVLREK